jgi:hypothetical protein
MSSPYIARDSYTYGARWFLGDFTDGVSTFNPAEQIIRIDNDSDFAVEKICYTYNYFSTPDKAYTREVGGFQVRIFDSTTGRYWDNDFVNLDTIAGTGAVPFVLPTPKIMVANSEIKIALRADVVPSDEDTPNFVFVLNFIGDKLFR